jgi:uncharacterized protein GlcG (DUF336 family)
MKTFNKTSISYELAWRLIEAAMGKAREIGLGISACIVDESGVLKAFGRMDNAPLISVDAARKKALTAVGLGIPTGDAWYNFIKDDPILSAGVHNFDDFLLLGGGIPLIIDGQMAGAIGISGGHYKQDELCAAAAIEII